MKANDLQLPAPVPLVLIRVKLHAMRGIGKGNGSDFSLEIDLGRGNTVYSVDFADQSKCKVRFIQTTDRIIQLVISYFDVMFLFCCRVFMTFNRTSAR